MPSYPALRETLAMMRALHEGEQQAIDEEGYHAALACLSELERRGAPTPQLFSPDRECVAFVWADRANGRRYYLPATRELSPFAMDQSSGERTGLTVDALVAQLAEPHA